MIEIKQLISPIFVKNNNISPQAFRISSVSSNKQIACGLRGIENDNTILIQKVLMCLDKCNSMNKSCPKECFCLWYI
jgi:hypothetical protein